MKISKISIQNLLGIEEFEFSPKKFNVISGDNEKGKTSILHAIEKTLSNNGRRTRIIKDGEDKAVLLMQIDGDKTIEVSRTLNREKADNFVVKENGLKQNRPDAYLTSLFTGFPFDPTDFLHKSEKEKAKTILNMIDLHIDRAWVEKTFGECPNTVMFEDRHGLEIIKQVEEYYYKTRTTFNAKLAQQIAEKNSLLANLPENYDGDEWKQVDLQSVIAKLTNANNHNATYQRAKEIVDRVDLKTQQVNATYKEKCIEIDNRAADRKKEIAKLIADYEQKIAVLKQEESTIDSLVQTEKEKAVIETNATLEKVNSNLVKAKEFLENNEEIDIEVLSEEAKTAEKMKSFVPMWDRIKEMEEVQIKNLTETCEALTEKVELARELPSKLLATAEKPIEGLSVDNEMNVTYNGLPLDNLSTKASMDFAIGIAKALMKNSAIKFICVDKFEAFSPKNQKLFLETAAAHDAEQGEEWQYFITTVTDGDLKVESFDPESDSQTASVLKPHETEYVDQIDVFSTDF